MQNPQKTHKNPQNNKHTKKTAKKPPQKQQTKRNKTKTPTKTKQRQIIYVSNLNGRPILYCMKWTQHWMIKY